jgi:hypothetical protein
MKNIKFDLKYCKESRRIIIKKWKNINLLDYEIVKRRR